MPRKSKKPVRKQTHSPTGKVVGQVGAGDLWRIVSNHHDPLVTQRKRIIDGQSQRLAKRLTSLR